MENQKQDVLGFGEMEDTPLIPDGWKEDDDIFADVREDLLTDADKQTETDDTATENEPEAEEQADDPTTEDAPEESIPNAEEPTETDTTVTEEKTPRILKLKVNHTEQEVDVDKLTDEDLIERLQKAAAFDALKDDQMKEKYRQVYQSEIQSGMSEQAAKMVAAHAVGGKDYPLEDAEETTTQEPVTPAPTKVSEPSRSTNSADFASQLKQLRALDPDCKKLPQEVLDAYVNGADLLTAYTMYQVRQSKQAAAKLEKENRVLKQNAAAAAKAPIKGVANSGAGGKEAEDDPFLKGLQSDPW